MVSEGQSSHWQNAGWELCESRCNSEIHETKGFTASQLFRVGTGMLPMDWENAHKL